MLFLTISLCFLALKSGLALKLEANVRMLAPKGLLQDVGACQTLEIRALQHWDSGLFSNCKYDYHYRHNETELEVVYKVEVDISKLPHEYQHNISYDYQMWYVNRLLNGKEERCLTATGEGQDVDRVEITGFIADHVPREKFILVTPFTEDMCKKIINHTFVNGQFTVLDCSLIGLSEKPVNSHILAKYNLTTLEMQENFVPFEYHDIHMLLLEELNGQSGTCMFNGYWAKVEFVEDHYKFGDQPFLDPEDVDEKEDEQEIIINIEDRK